MLRDEDEREAKRRAVQAECEAYNEGLEDRPARRRAARYKFNPGSVTTLPFSRNRAQRRHPVMASTVEADPNAKWRGSKMFAQRHKKRAKGIL